MHQLVRISRLIICVQRKRGRRMPVHKFKGDETRVICLPVVASGRNIVGLQRVNEAH